MAIGVCPRAKQYATAARVAEFIPPAGAPTCIMAIRICCTTLGCSIITDTGGIEDLFFG